MVNNKKIIYELKGALRGTKIRNTKLLKQNERLLNEIAAYRVVFKAHMKPDFIPKQLEDCKCLLSQIKLNFVSRFCGIYFLIQCEEVVYVGQSVNIISRVGSHTKDKEFDSVFFIQCDQCQLAIIEREWITRLLPAYNKDSNARKLKKIVQRSLTS